MVLSKTTKTALVCCVFLAAAYGATACAPPTAAATGLRGGARRADTVCVEELVDKWLLQWLKNVELQATIGIDSESSPATTTRMLGMGQLLGEDVDEFGCRPSTGYTWCSQREACIPQWEACDSILSTPAANAKKILQTFAATAPTVVQMIPLLGDEVDEFGCRPSTGYAWCPLRAACIPQWETCKSSSAATTTNPSRPSILQTDTMKRTETMKMFGEEVDEFGCRPSSGYVWCDVASACLPSWQECSRTASTVDTEPPRLSQDQGVRPAARDPAKDQYTDNAILRGSTAAKFPPTDQYRDNTAARQQPTKPAMVDEAPVRFSQTQEHKSGLVSDQYKGNAILTKPPADQYHEQNVSRQQPTKADAGAMLRGVRKLAIVVNKEHTDQYHDSGVSRQPTKVDSGVPFEVPANGVVRPKIRRFPA